MKKAFNRFFALVLGWFLVGLGIIGLFVPILQGVLLILLGLWVLSRESQWAKRRLHQLRGRFPAADRRLREFKWTSRKGPREPPDPVEGPSD